MRTCLGHVLPLVVIKVGNIGPRKVYEDFEKKIIIKNSIMYINPY